MRRILLGIIVIAAACSSKPTPPPSEPMPLPPTSDEVKPETKPDHDGNMKVLGLEPANGPAEGGNAVRIKGANFRLASGVKVLFNKSPAPVLRTTDDEIVVQAPAGSAGEVATVTVLFEPGGEMELRGAYTYTAP